jgi:uncharacterized XkdX family phage protein
MDFDWFYYINLYYQMGLYQKSDVAVAVQQGYITADQYKQITGDDYAADSGQTTNTAGTGTISGAAPTTT